MSNENNNKKTISNKNNKFCAAGIKRYHHRKTFWEIFAAFSYAIDLLATHNAKSKVTSIAGAACDQITLRVANNLIDLWQNDGKTWDCCFFS